MASKVFAVAYNHDIDAGRAVGLAGESVGVADAPPHRFESVVYAVGIGPVIV